MSLALLLLGFLSDLFKMVGPDVQKIIAAWVKQNRERLDLEAPGWAREIEHAINTHDDAAATDLVNRLREGAAGH